MSKSIVPIVEGKAEVESVRIILLRLLAEAERAPGIEVVRPFRVKRNQVVRPGQLERAVEQAVRDRQDPGAVLVLLDADDDCPKELGPELTERARLATRLPVAVVLANRELEAWFLGAKESLRGERGIREDAASPTTPEEIRGAKERLTDNMTSDQRYLGVDDQPALAAKFDMGRCRLACPSFDKLFRETCSLIRQMQGTSDASI